MIEMDVKVTGLKVAMEVLDNSIGDPTQQRKIINGAMGYAARKHFLPIAKQLANEGDKSGALAESLKVRAMPVRKRRKRGVVAGMELIPVRYDKKAMAKYVNYYYTQEGKKTPGSKVIDGIRHGHLIEFGFTHRSKQEFSGRPFLLPAVKEGMSAFQRTMAAGIKKRAENAVKRERSKRSSR